MVRRSVSSEEGNGWNGEVTGQRYRNRTGRPMVQWNMPLTGEYAPSTSKWARDQAELYEASGGTEGTMLHGKPVVILTSKGAKTGKLRKTALMRVEHEGRYAVVAPKNGAAEHPCW